LALQVVPGLSVWFNTTNSWPFMVIGIGVLLLLFALIGQIPGMAIPGAVVSGVGAVLYFQNLTGNWESWAYAWTLIPGFVGVGILIRSLLVGQTARSMQGALWLILSSAVLFTISAAFFGAIGFIGVYWPVVLIAFGVLLLLRPIFRPR